MAKRPTRVKMRRPAVHVAVAALVFVAVLLAVLPRLDHRLNEEGVPHLLVDLPWASHGCDYFLRGPCGQISTYAVEQFLARVLAAH